MSRSERRVVELEAEVVRLRRLLSDQMRTGESLEVEAIVNPGGVPKVNFRWDMLAAQVEPDLARRLAYDILRVAEWADVDSVIFRAMRERYGERDAGGILAMIREWRGGDPQRSTEALELGRKAAAG